MANSEFKSGLDMMTNSELISRISAMKKDTRWLVYLNAISYAQFSIGYEFDENAKMWIVYENGERGRDAEWTFESEHEALKRLYIMVKCRLNQICVVVKGNRVIKKGEYAVYKGKEYAACRIADILELYSGSIEDVDNGFRLCEPFVVEETKEKMVCMKCVKPWEVEKHYTIKTTAFYGRHNFDVIDETDDEVLIEAQTDDLGTPDTWISYGLERCEDGGYRRWIKKNEVQISVDTTKHNK